MSIASEPLSSNVISQGVAEAESRRPPKKRRIQSYTDQKILPEAR